MSVIEILGSKFEGDVCGDPLRPEEFDSFAARWGRRVPAELQSFLLEVNGIQFADYAIHNDLWVVGFHPIGGIESTLRTYGETIPPYLVPFAQSVSDDQFCLDSRIESGAVWLLSVIDSEEHGRKAPRQVADSLGQFAEELRYSSEAP